MEKVDRGVGRRAAASKAKFNYSSDDDEDDDSGAKAGSSRNSINGVETFDIKVTVGHSCKLLVTIRNQDCLMAKFVPFLSLDCASVEGGAQSKERKGSNFAIRQSWFLIVTRSLQL